MIYINFKDWIEIIPDMLEMLLPGLLFLCIYNWLTSRINADSTKISLWCLFISLMIKTFYQTLHLFLLTSINFPEPLKIFIYSASGALLAVAFFWLRKSRVLGNMVDKLGHKSINDDVWDDIVDYDKPTMMKVYLKGADIYYSGRFCTREENGLDSWIVLIDYARASKNNELQYCPEDHNQKSMVSINLRDIERIEIVYQDNSRVWNKYSPTR